MKGIIDDWAKDKDLLGNRYCCDDDIDDLKKRISDVFNESSDPRFIFVRLMFGELGDSDENT